MYIEPADRSQYQLMSSLDDSISANNPVRIIDKLIDEIVSANKGIFEKEKPTEAGRPAYRDLTFLKLYLYGYFNGISSSRKLEAETHRNIEVIWLLGKLSPDHWTISNYRKENGDKIKLVTRKIREYLRDNGYIKMKTVAIDGSKVKAYTNRDMLDMKRINNQMIEIDKKIEEYLSKLTENDIIEDVREEVDREGTGEVERAYLDKIIELQNKLEKLEEQKGILEKEGKNYISAADPEANLMKSRDGKIPAYNVQIAVDAENGMIIDSEVVTKETDTDQLQNMIESIKEELGKAPEEALADKGYQKPDSIEAIEIKEPGIKLYVSPKATSKDKEIIKFTYNKENDEYICSAGKRLILKQKNMKHRNTIEDVYQGIECSVCPRKAECTKSKTNRKIHRYKNQEWRDNFKLKMKSDLGRHKISLRKAIVEHPFGTIKYLMGKIPLLLRGVKKVSTEINIYTTVYNLKRLINLEDFYDNMRNIQRYDWGIA
jgi:transposase